MAQYRKRPVVIEARQYKGEQCDALLLMAWMKGHGVESLWGQGQVHIPTLEGVMTASPGDWIIRGVQGEFYPCKDEIFRATYESVDA